MLPPCLHWMRAFLPPHHAMRSAGPLLPADRITQIPLLLKALAKARSKLAPLAYRFIMLKLKAKGLLSRPKRVQLREEEGKHRERTLCMA